MMIYKIFPCCEHCWTIDNTICFQSFSTTWFKNRKPDICYHLFPIESFFIHMKEMEAESVLFLHFYQFFFIFSDLAIEFFYSSKENFCLYGW